MWNSLTRTESASASAIRKIPPSSVWAGTHSFRRSRLVFSFKLLKVRGKTSWMIIYIIQKIGGNLTNYVYQ